MRRQISSLDFSMHFILAIATSIVQFVIAFILTITAITSFNDEIGIAITFLLFSFYCFFFAVRYSMFSFNLVDLIITENGIIIERFVKKEELPFSAIKETKYWYPGFFALHIIEPRIKITFNKRTVFGEIVYIIPTSFNENKRFQLNADIKAFLDSKIKN